MAETWHKPESRSAAVCFLDWRGGQTCPSDHVSGITTGSDRLSFPHLNKNDEWMRKAWACQTGDDLYVDEQRGQRWRKRLSSSSSSSSSSSPVLHWFISFPLSTERSRKTSINTSGMGGGGGGGGEGQEVYRMLFEFWILFSFFFPRSCCSAGAQADLHPPLHLHASQTHPHSLPPSPILTK